MTKTTTNELTIKTGKRTWTLWVVKRTHGGNLLHCVSASGKGYLVNLRTRTMSATRVMRDKRTKLYHWDVTAGLPHALPSRPMLAKAA